MVGNKIHNLIDRQENDMERTQNFTDLFGVGEGKTYHGRITKQCNKYPRWILIETVIPATRKDAQIRSYYYSMKAKKGSNSAKVATTRRLLKIVHQIRKRKYFTESSHQGSL